MEQLQPQPQNPHMVIQMLKQQFAAMGRNDHEFSTLQNILDRYESQDPAVHISAEEAMSLAQKIKDQKEAYDYN